jgi:hypothetical protein
MLNLNGGSQDGRRGRGRDRDPFDMLKRQAGARVYWTHLKSEEGDQGEYSVSGTGYFEDLNDLNQNAGLKVSFRPAETGGGHVCELHGSLEELAKKIPGGGGLELPTGGTLTAEQQQQLEAFKPMLAGFDMRVRVVMPGAVASAEGLKAGEGREAKLAINEGEFLDMLVQPQGSQQQMRVTSAAPDAKALEPEIAQFKKELAAAKAATEAERAKKDAPAAPKSAPTPAPEKKDDGGKKPQQDF